jgi:hypothetical protein
VSLQDQRRRLPKRLKPMEHEWRKHAIVNGTVMACMKCGDVKREFNRKCPGVDEASFIQSHILNMPPKRRRRIDLQALDIDKLIIDYSI